MVAAYAFLTSLMTFVVFGTGGIVLAGLENSGAQGSGLAIAALAAGAFACALVLALAPVGAFRGGARRPAGVAATFVAALPVGALGTAAILFVGSPFGSAIPTIEWPLFAAGFLFGLGALSVVTLGYLRVTEAPVGLRGEEDEEEIPSRPTPAPADQWDPRWEPEDATEPGRDADDVRVTRV